VSFRGSQRPDGRFTRFELRQTALDKAELKLLETPVEEHPWQLVKVQKPEYTGKILDADKVARRESAA
jgi:hypothetical protein